PGDLALSPKPLWQTTSSSTLNSTRYLHNATHLKLRNVNLSYNLPNEWMRRLGSRSASVTLTADDIDVWTPYDKKDSNSYKQNMSGYPMERTVTLGLNIQI